MVRFSCFQTNTHCSKSKKEFQRPAESISKAIEDCSQVRGIKASGVPSYPDFKSNTLEQVFSSSSLDRFSNSEDMHTISDISQMTHLRKSQSLGSALNREGKVSSSVNSEDEVDQGFSSNHSDEHNEAGNLTSLHHHVMVQPFHGKDPETSPPNQYEMCLAQESSPANDDVLHTETFSSSEDTGHDRLPNQLSSEHADYSGRSTPGTPPTIEKSQSVPNFGVFSPTGEKGSPSHMHVATRSRSFMDLNELDEEREEVQNHEAHFHAMEDEERDRGIFESITDQCDDFSPDRYESYSFINSVKDWTLSGMDEVDMMKKHEKEPPVNSWDELPTKDFKIKRIEEWVSTIDLGESSPLKDQTETSFAVDKVKKGSHVVGSATTAKLDSKSTHGMEAAKKYLASLTATSTSAQLGNLGLVVIPFLSAFVSLKVLNLSGNSIVRITAGALPRGLHALNLAKNKISTIEGLRELTRLRVLDLSYNRILRIGHGLASCSSLKELYLAGNKISEVEGLHRLLKLNILDLRFNKISTAKCLGQLAANYSSLQAINLEGNPAQRNVGDEHMKKYLQSLLPHLVYFNKQSIKANSSKEVADRSARSVITSHQFDRGLRSDHKLNRKGKLIAAPSKASTSSHVHRSHAVNSPKRSKDQRHLPPPATKGSHHRHHFLDLGTKLLSLKPDLRRSRSEGNLGDS